MTNLCGVSSVANWQVMAANGRSATMGTTTSDAAVTGTGVWRPTMSDQPMRTRTGMRVCAGCHLWTDVQWFRNRKWRCSFCMEADDE